MALLGALALHVLLAVLVASKVTSQVPEPPTMTVTLVQLAPRAKPPPPVRPKTAPKSSAPRRAPPPDGPDLTPRPAVPAQDWRVRPLEAPEAEGARTPLRGRLGCRSVDLLALTKAERAACEEALAKGVENSPTYAVISPKLKKVFDRTFECPKGDVWCEYRIGKAPYPGLLAPRRPPRDRSWDGN